MTINANKRLQVFRRDNFTCISCGKNKRLTIDHIIPVSKGGSDDIDNLQTMCYWCNTEKGDHQGKWWHKFLPFVNHKALSKIRNEMLGAMISKDVLLKKEVLGEVDKRFTGIQPKVQEWMMQGLKKAEENAVLKINGFKNSLEAYNNRSLERDKALRGYIKILAKRIDDLEDLYENNPKR